MQLSMNRSVELLRVGVDGVLVACQSSDEEAAAAFLMIKDSMPDHLGGLMTRTKGIADALDLATAAWADALWWDGPLVAAGGGSLTESGRHLVRGASAVSDLTCLFRAHPSWPVLHELRRTGSLIPVFQEMAGALKASALGSTTGLMITSGSNWAVLDRRIASHINAAVFIADAAMDSGALTHVAGTLKRSVPESGVIQS